MRSLVAGIDPTFVDLSAGFQVAEFADAAEELRADAARCYTALTPMQLLKGMDTLQGIEALRLFDAILVGGGPLLDDDRRAARELGIRVVTTYGSAETTGGCVYNGLPLPGVTIRLENERIMVGGPMVAQGYRNFPGHEAFSRPGFYRTSDTGLLRNGVLRVTGRIDTIIDSGGLKIHPEVLEQVFINIAGVDSRPAAGASHRGRIHGFRQHGGHYCGVSGLSTVADSQTYSAGGRTTAHKFGENRPQQSGPIILDFCVVSALLWGWLCDDCGAPAWAL